MVECPCFLSDVSNGLKHADLVGSSRSTARQHQRRACSVFVGGFRQCNWVLGHGMIIGRAMAFLSGQSLRVNPIEGKPRFAHFNKVKLILARLGPPSGEINGSS